MYISILTVCRLFHIPIINVYTIKLYSPCDVHTCPTICMLLPLCIKFICDLLHSFMVLNCNLEPITSKTVNVCTSTQTVYPNV